MNTREPSPDQPLRIEMPLGGRVTLRPFPHDRRFLRDIRRAALAVGASAATDHDLRGLLQGALRAWYPHVDIRVREDLAGLSDEDQVWYVLRDGQVQQGREQSNRLYAAMSDARATAEQSDQAVERANAALTFARQPRSRRVRTETP